MAQMADGWWINPQGKTIRIIEHASYIVDHPEEFGMSEEDIWDIERKWNKGKFRHGNAGKGPRYEMISIAYKEGWTRVRDYLKSVTIQSGRLTQKIRENITTFMDSNPQLSHSDVGYTEFKPIKNFKTKGIIGFDQEKNDHIYKDVEALYWVEDPDAFTQEKTLQWYKFRNWIATKETEVDMTSVSSILRYMKNNPTQKVFESKITYEDIVKYASEKELKILIEGNI